jgi:multicomponent Na+:H+ antiporter subunit G
MEALIDLVRNVLGGALIGVGLVFITGGAVGVLRFPDFYTRLHAARAADGLGAVIFIIGLIILAGDAAMALRLTALAALVVALAPVMAHLSANAAHVGGLAPLAGPYRAPRPGPRRQAP